MSKNKYLKNFNEYRSRTYNEINDAYSEIIQKYRNDLIIEESYARSKENIKSERNKLNVLIREKDGSLSIINGVMIPVSIFIYTIELSIIQQVENPDILEVFYITLITSIILGIFLYIIVKCESSIVYNRNTYSICLECLDDLDKEIKEEKKYLQRNFNDNSEAIDESAVNSDRKSVLINKILKKSNRDF